MQLSDARLCLDCDEVHDQGRCPICASESFAFIKRWVTTPERRDRPVVADKERSETLATYRELLDGNGERRLTAKQLLRGGAVGLAMLGAGWLLQKNLRDREKTDATGSSAVKDRAPGAPPTT